MPLIEYINKFYRGNQASFARLTGVQPAQVTQWIRWKQGGYGKSGLRIQR